MNTVELQVQRHRLEGIAEEMGDVLQRTAFSPNIKERRDFSCALCDPKGRLVAQAAHIPVHLGAVPVTMRSFLSEVDADKNTGYLLNDPYAGGTHLPDISYIEPVFVSGQLVGYVINRAHHTDVGGGKAGSMSRSSHVDEEGFRSGPRVITRNGELKKSSIEDLLSISRTPDQRITDLEAQVASARRGRNRLNEWISAVQSFDVVYEQLMNYSRTLVQNFIQALPDEEVTSRDFLDDDGYDEQTIPIRVKLSVSGDSMTFNFKETADQVEGNLNCPRSVTASASYYVVRCFVGESVPMNHGVIDPVTVQTRSGSLLDVEYPGAVAGGNVETSQRIVDVLLKAFDELVPGSVPAASQGTMNNLTIGYETKQTKRTYYETLGGGGGGGPEHHGISGRQVHMTNTQNTPIEEFERRFPLRIDRLRIRENSGGEGTCEGGDGLIKSWTALDDVMVSLLTERRLRSAYGLRAEDGRPGENYIGSEEDKQTLPGKTIIDLHSGETLTVETPGGGGWNPDNKC